jgi:hypothetical protein
MNSSWLSLYAGEGERPYGEEGPFGTLVNRTEAFRVMGSGHRFDLIVFGCGLSGVTVAREAALRGAQVLLIEPGYPGATSCAWRESVLGELTLSPWRLIRSTRALREVVTSLAPHLATVRRCDLSRFRGLGARLAKRALRAVTKTIDTSGVVADIPDLDERLLIRELALAARQEGVFVLGGTAAEYVERDVESGTFRVSVRDLFADERVVVQGGGLFVDPTYVQPLASRIGTPITKIPQSTQPHIIVVCRVEGGEGLGSLWHFEISGARMATTCEFSPGVLEVALLDCAEGLESEKLSERARHLCEASGYTFVSEISRRRVGCGYGTEVGVENRRGILIPREGAPWSFVRVVQKALDFVEDDGSSIRPRRALPGEWRSGERQEFVERARLAGVAQSTVDSVIERWKGRVRYIPEMPGAFEEVCPGVLRGEISLAVASDHVCSLEDLLFGSLALQTTPGWRELVAPIAAALAATGDVAPEALHVERVLVAMSAA